MSGFSRIFRDSPPRINLFFLAISLKMGYSSLIGIFPFSFLKAGFWTIGFWLLWFGTLWLVVMPQTDHYFIRWTKQLRWIAQTSVMILALIGVIVGGSYLGLRSSAIQAIVFLDPFRNSLQILEIQPHYCDGTALVHQATGNLIKGENPYASANVITALEEFDRQYLTQRPYTNVTPLQIGYFTEVFPYPSPEQLDALWQEARLTPGTVPDEVESHLCYPAGSFLLMTPFLLAGIDNMRIPVKSATDFGPNRPPSR